MPQTINGSGGLAIPGGGHPLETGGCLEPARHPPNLAAVREALQWGYRDALREHGELLESLGISLREAAFRGDDVTAKAHVAQARLVVLAAIDAAKDLERVGAEGFG
jgi:hypothetical protein